MILRLPFQHKSKNLLHFRVSEKKYYISISINVSILLSFFICLPICLYFHKSVTCIFFRLFISIDRIEKDMNK